MSDLKATRFLQRPANSPEVAQPNVTSVGISPDGRQALLGNVVNTLELLDLPTGGCLRRLEGHTDRVKSMCISPDGRKALSGSHDRTLKLWDLATGRCLRSFEGHTGEVTSVCISPDGRRALSGSEDGTVGLWQLDWEYEFPAAVDWDDGARPHIVNFLTLHTPLAAPLPEGREPTEEEIRLALTRCGRPSWDEEDFKKLLYTLACAGYGWLRPEGVRHELEKMAADWQGPPPDEISTEESSSDDSGNDRDREGDYMDVRAARRALIEQSHEHYHAGRFEQALEVVHEAQRRFGDDHELWNDEAAFLTDLERYQEALDCLDKAISAAPQWFSLWCNKGRALRALGRAEEALDSYDRAIACDANQILPWTNKGNCLVDLNRRDEAHDCYARAAAIAPEDPIVVSAVRNSGSGDLEVLLEAYQAYGRGDYERAIERAGQIEADATLYVHVVPLLREARDKHNMGPLVNKSFGRQEQAGSRDAAGREQSTDEIPSSSALSSMDASRQGDPFQVTVPVEDIRDFETYLKSHGFRLVGRSGGATTLVDPETGETETFVHGYHYYLTSAGNKRDLLEGRMYSEDKELVLATSPSRPENPESLKLWVADCEKLERVMAHSKWKCSRI